METFTVILAVLLYLGDVTCNQPLSNQLHRDILGDYQPDVIPIFEKGKPVEVRFGISLQQIMKVDVHASTFVAQVWLNYMWNDKRLVWNVSEANGVQSLRIKEEDIWVPDIRMYNSMADERVFDTHVVVYHGGTCSFVPPVQVTASCAYDMKWFPYDTQYCTMKFGSWTYDGTKLNLTKMSNEMDVSTYMPNQGWDLVSVPAKRNVQKYECCPEPYIDVTFTAEIKRRGSKYAWEYITPAVILCFLIPVLFLLPSDNSSRFALGAGMLISIMFLMDQLRWTLPEELIARPMLGVYYDMMFILTSLGMAISAVIASVSSKSSGMSPPPGILKTIFLNGLGRICCVTYDSQYGTPAGSDMDGTAKGDSQTGAAASALYEWRLIARVLDRLFLLIFFIIVIIGSLAILPK